MSNGAQQASAVNEKPMEVQARSRRIRGWIDPLFGEGDAPCCKGKPTGEFGRSAVALMHDGDDCRGKGDDSRRSIPDAHRHRSGHRESWGEDENGVERRCQALEVGAESAHLSLPETRGYAKKTLPKHCQPGNALGIRYD